MHSNGLGTRIREARKAAGLKQTELAVELDVTQATIANYEREVTTPSLGRLSDIAARLGVSIAWLIEGTEVAA